MGNFNRLQAQQLCEFLNGPDPLDHIEELRALTLSLLGSYLSASGMARQSEVVYNKSVGEWLTKDGYRWLPKDNISGLGPAGESLEALDVFDGDVGSLDTSRTHVLNKWVWRS